jgi:uncharacterized protein (DUF4415 family)
MKHSGSDKPLTSRQRAALAKLAALPDAKIDTSDIPEVTFTGKAQRGRFFGPRKASVTIRLDEDIIDYYRAQSPEGRYQTEINRVLREHMTEK